ncbi:hypothetical protein JTE90_000346 [Oedothorax gibbosus]|uniref:Uncharacterized protein n=1 Tax=Oedothorax gibbosus TaxID=931172 RepID=A0AAV6U017_9ARAC|nr:hypothetical protein JTE90_000346 [Oedothorax gibbosus]
MSTSLSTAFYRFPCQRSSVSRPLSAKCDERAIESSYNPALSIHIILDGYYNLSPLKVVSETGEKLTAL